jgi:cysteinyl-tRNA synthetase
MALKLFNTLTRSVEEFLPLDPEGKNVKMYCCGPTVHEHAHIGNFRTFIFADLVRRYLEFKGYTVEHVMNITDVEDKIIRRVQERNELGHPSADGISSRKNAQGRVTESQPGLQTVDRSVQELPSENLKLADITRPNEAAFLQDLEALRCLVPHHLPRATEHIREMISLIERLIARGMAYATADGSVYFSIEKYRASGHQYGQLMKLNVEQMRVGERVKNDEYPKESLADFALWKARNPEDGEIFWPSPWGKGRPGWHIECSAMSMKLLGPTFDLHLGGEDLIFPHHEDEIAQSEGAGVQPSGERFVRYWLHCAHLLVDGRKMSKSLGNFYTLRDLTDKGFSGAEIRYLLLGARYRESFNFTIDGLLGARSALERLSDFLGKLREIARRTDGEPDPLMLERFSRALDDDLNTSAAWGEIFAWIRENNRLIAGQELSVERAAVALATWKRINFVFNLDPPQFTMPDGIPSPEMVGVPIVSAGVSPDLQNLLEEREAARQAKDFRRADSIREELKSKGWSIEDTPKGPRLKRIVS